MCWVMIQEWIDMLIANYLFGMPCGRLGRYFAWMHFILTSVVSLTILRVRSTGVMIATQQVLGFGTYLLSGRGGVRVKSSSSSSCAMIVNLEQSSFLCPAGPLVILPRIIVTLVSHTPKT